MGASICRHSSAAPAAHDLNGAQEAAGTAKKLAACLNAVPLPHTNSDPRWPRLPAPVPGPARRRSRQLPRGHTPDGAAAYCSSGSVQPPGEGREGRKGVLRPLHDVSGHGWGLGVRDEGRRPDFGKVGALFSRAY